MGGLIESCTIQSVNIQNYLYLQGFGLYLEIRWRLNTRVLVLLFCRSISHEFIREKVPAKQRSFPAKQRRPESLKAIQQEEPFPRRNHLPLPSSRFLFAGYQGSAKLNQGSAKLNYNFEGLGFRHLFLAFLGWQMGCYNSCLFHFSEIDANFDFQKLQFTLQLEIAEGVASKFTFSETNMVLLPGTFLSLLDIFKTRYGKSMVQQNSFFLNHNTNFVQI